ncbi:MULTISPECIES: DUF554 domain-containing protein [Eubacteriales]|uniref:DUF554 domain-containing protein n=1 Tax=Eubacteriales TaxID=186802 RepID=UPI000B399914|nr:MULTISPECIES: DUF554 domain-containing protein [Eubacteriales]OUP25468.1 hypothetical protein B5F28_01935 [Gemmiger sp. An194]
MIGTIANTATILAGSLVGSRLKSGLGERYKEALMNGMGLAATLLGVNSVVQAMPESRYSVLFIVSLAVGGVLGTAISLDSLFQKAVDKLPLAGGSELGKGLSTAILLFCAGTLSILGPMQSALQGDNTYLFTNAVLDGITSTVLASTFGIGIALAALVLFCWQGAIYLLSGAIAPYVTTELLTELSLVGGALIFSSGLGILGIKQIKTLNYLPALAVSAAAVVVLQALGL